MVTKTVCVNNETGLHARPASKVIKTAGGFSSDIHIEHENKVINAKSIVSLLSAAVKGKSKVVLKVSGDDEIEAMAAMTDLLESALGE